MYLDVKTPVMSISQELAYEWRTSLYLAASASAEFFADMLLAPMEATKVPFPVGLSSYRFTHESKHFIPQEIVNVSRS